MRAVVAAASLTVLPTIIDSVMTFLITKALISQMIAHALESDPSECCGLLTGRDFAERVHPMRNVHPRPERRYEMSPMDLMSAEQEAESRGESIVAIYHSHTFTQAYPSQTDANNAVQSGWTDPVYVLISLAEKTRPVVRAYRISDEGAITELPITTDGQAYVEVA